MNDSLTVIPPVSKYFVESLFKQHGAARIMVVDTILIHHDIVATAAAIEPVRSAAHGITTGSEVYSVPRSTAPSSIPMVQDLNLPAGWQWEPLNIWWPARISNSATSGSVIFTPRFLDAITTS
jgi:hypothetical protein